MKYPIFVFAFVVNTLIAFAQPDKNSSLPWATHGKLMVSKQDPYFLSYADGTAFFWLGDTGWEMLHLLNREEIKFYLATRREQGFTVIQTVAISEFDGLTKANAYGSLPLIGKDPLKPAITSGASTTVPGEYDYWDHVEFAINEAAAQGLYIALLPCWGEYVVPRENHAIFFTIEQAYQYGRFLGNRFGSKPNIIWILGGDRQPDETNNGIALWRSMAKGIADGTNRVNDINGKTDYSSTLMTYHSSQSSSKWFQNDDWLDFNMWGSYHDNFSNTKAFEQVIADYSLPVAKPTINGEAAYEEHPVNWLLNNGIFTAYDIRQIAYWSVLAGAFGHTYGCNPVWQFYDTARPFSYFAHTAWKKALFDEGAVQMKYLKNLILSRPFFNRHIANDMIITGEGLGADHCVASLGRGFAFIYLPTGKPVSIQLSKMKADQIRAWWFNPRNGGAILIRDFTRNETPVFSPPGISKELDWLKTGRGCDWVLVLDNKENNFPAPGMP